MHVHVYICIASTDFSTCYMYVCNTDKSIWKALQDTYCKKGLCQSSDDLLDVFCGKEYRTHTFLMSPDNLSFTLNTDGVAVFRSSKNSLWPVWLVINELPPAERYMYIHVITL